MRLVRGDANEMRLSLGQNFESLARVDNMLIEAKQELMGKLRTMTPHDEFKSSISGFEEKNRKLVYSCRDLNNKIRTTDRYIDQFLPFRMIKEVSHFMEYLFPAEMSKKIECLRKEKIKDLYTRIFESADVIEFKNAMSRLTTEA